MIQGSLDFLPVLAKSHAELIENCTKNLNTGKYASPSPRLFCFVFVFLQTTSFKMHEIKQILHFQGIKKENNHSLNLYMIN